MSNDSEHSSAQSSEGDENEELREEPERPQKRKRKETGDKGSKKKKAKPPVESSISNFRKKSEKIKKERIEFAKDEEKRKTEMVSSLRKNAYYRTNKAFQDKGHYSLINMRKHVSAIHKLLKRQVGVDFYMFMTPESDLSEWAEDAVPVFRLPLRDSDLEVRFHWSEVLSEGKYTVFNSKTREALEIGPGLEHICTKYNFGGTNPYPLVGDMLRDIYLPFLNRYIIANFNLQREAIHEVDAPVALISEHDLVSKLRLAF